MANKMTNEEAIKWFEDIRDAAMEFVVKSQSPIITLGCTPKRLLDITEIAIEALKNKWRRNK